MDKLRNVIAPGTAAPTASETMCIVMPDPAGGGDHGFYGRFMIPKNYSSTPVLVVTFVINGTAANTVGLGVRMLGTADNESVDTALSTADLNGSGKSLSGYTDEDSVEDTITLSTPTLAVDDVVDFYLFNDDSVTTFTGDVCVTGVYFQYTEA